MADGDPRVWGREGMDLGWMRPAPWPVARDERPPWRRWAGRVAIGFGLLVAWTLAIGIGPPEVVVSEEATATFCGDTVMLRFDGARVDPLTDLITKDGGRLPRAVSIAARYRRVPPQRQLDEVVVERRTPWLGGRDRWLVRTSDGPVPVESARFGSGPTCSKSRS